MPPKSKPSAVREQVMVYLTEQERALLEQLAETTGLARTELLRRGLYLMASTSLTSGKPGSSMEYLAATASDQDVPPDLSANADDYLYGGGYERWFAGGRQKRAVSEKRGASDKREQPEKREKKPRARLR